MSLENSHPHGPVVVKSTALSRALKKFHRRPHHFAFCRDRLLIFDETELNIYQGASYQKVATARLPSRDSWDNLPAINEARGPIALEDGKKVIVWNLEGKRVHKVAAKQKIACFAISYDGNLLAMGTEKGNLSMSSLPASIEEAKAPARKKKIGTPLKMPAGKKAAAKLKKGYKKA